MNQSRKTIAVFFGGRSVEHDVSVLTGLQFLEALDPDRYAGLPVYVDPDGCFWTGNLLKKRSRYPLGEDAKKELTAISLDIGAGKAGKPKFSVVKKGLLGESRSTLSFDLAVPAIHGSNGEDGSLQGLFEFMNIPYAGCRMLGSAATIDKNFTKTTLAQHGVPVLAHAALSRRTDGSFWEKSDVEKALQEAFSEITFPLCVKPHRLGSSIGVARANDWDSLIAALISVFRIDETALIEPFVANLVEYNISASRAFGDFRLSAIERPLQESAFLDFKDKYLAGSGGVKLDDAPVEGMAAQNRVLHPEELTDDQQALIFAVTAKAFDVFGLTGIVRIDFLCDSKTGGLWLNEINSIPGSFAFYLWKAASPAVSFSELATAMIEEGFREAAAKRLETDVVKSGGAIFQRD